MARIGIVGFPNSGKTTLFNALTGLRAETAPHPFSTTSPNVGVAVIPDQLLDRLASLEGSARVTHATLDLLDLPAMGKPGHGTGLGTQFVGRLREMDALAIVLRAFDDPAVPSDESGLDPVGQAQELGLELTLADHEVFERRRLKIEKEATADPAKKPAAAAVARAAALLAGGTPLRADAWTAAEAVAFRDLASLTLQPAVWVVNIAEDDPKVDSWEPAVREVVLPADPVVEVSARLEAEAAELDADDRAELFEGLGLGEGVLARMVAATYRALGMISFYTTGPKESRAWTVRGGTTAREAAGKVHSDLARGFIRAEVAPLRDVVEAGGWDVAHRVGAVRVEGKDYVVAEGDVIHVRFSV